MLKLNDRLAKIANLLLKQKYQFVVDVGTDHCYLPIYLHFQQFPGKIIATEHLPGPLTIAKNNLKQFRLQNKIELYLTNNLTFLTPSLTRSCIVIAGLGGLTIIKILKTMSESLVNIDLLLQPQSSLEELLNYLKTKSFFVNKMHWVFEKKCQYVILTAHKLTN